MAKKTRKTKMEGELALAYQILDDDYGFSAEDYSARELKAMSFLLKAVADLKEADSKLEVV